MWLIYSQHKLPTGGMNMLKIDFTDDEATELLYWKERHPHAKVRKKMSVLYLKSQNLPHKEIKRLERISENTLLE